MRSSPSLVEQDDAGFSLDDQRVLRLGVDPDRRFRHRCRGDGNDLGLGARRPGRWEDDACRQQNRGEGGNETPLPHAPLLSESAVRDFGSTPFSRSRTPSVSSRRLYARTSRADFRAATSSPILPLRQAVSSPRRKHRTSACPAGPGHDEAKHHHPTSRNRRTTRGVARRRCRPSRCIQTAVSKCGRIAPSS